MSDYCRHPPREWFRGALMPCAEPTCADGCPGESLAMLVYSEDGRGEQVRFARFLTATVLGFTYSWELRSKRLATPARRRRAVRIGSRR